MTLAADDPRHGTANGYNNLGCRCQPCRDAWAVWCADRKARRRLEALGLAEPTDIRAGAPVHGRASTYYNWSCRCDECRNAATDESRARYGRAEQRRFSDEDKAAAVADAAERGIGPVAAALRLTRQTVSRWCKERGVTPPRSDAASHGTPYYSRRYGCRCDACRQAVIERQRRRRHQPTPATVTHGTVSTYVNYGCRCDECREAHSARLREHRQSRKAS